jgi:hypothetical protein
MADRHYVGIYAAAATFKLSTLCLFWSMIVASSFVLSTAELSDTTTAATNTTRFALTNVGLNHCPPRSAAAAVFPGRTALQCANRCRDYQGCVAYNFRGDFQLCELFTATMQNEIFRSVPKCRHMMLEQQP